MLNRKQERPSCTFVGYLGFLPAPEMTQIVEMNAFSGGLSPTAPFFPAVFVQGPPGVPSGAMYRFLEDEAGGRRLGGSALESKGESSHRPSGHPYLRGRPYRPPQPNHTQIIVKS